MGHSLKIWSKLSEEDMCIDSSQVSFAAGKMLESLKATDYTQRKDDKISSSYLIIIMKIIIMKTILVCF